MHKTILFTKAFKLLIGFTNNPLQTKKKGVNISFLIVNCNK